MIPGPGVGDGLLISDDVLQVTPRAALIAPKVVRMANHLSADEPVPLALTRRQRIAAPLRGRPDHEPPTDPRSARNW